MKSSEGRKKWFLEEMYWDLRGQFGAGKDLGSTFVPPNYNKDIDLVDPLQQMAYHSLRYDHLGGPPHHYINQLKRRQHRQSSSTGSGSNIQERFSDKDEEQWVVLLEQNMHPNRTLVNPNNTWDISQSASSLMRRVFHFNNFLHLITVLMHIGLIIPLSTSLLGIGEKLDKITITNNKISSKRNSNTLSLLKFLFQFLVGRNK